MGQYFEWVNYDKREIIMIDPWPNGQKLRWCAYIGCPETDAALTMLAGDWAGELVMFLGDYARFKDETRPGRREMEHRLNRAISDDCTYGFTDTCGRFDYVCSHPEVMHFVEYDDGGYDMASCDSPLRRRDSSAQVRCERVKEGVRRPLPHGGAPYRQGHG